MSRIAMHREIFHVVKRDKANDNVSSMSRERVETLEGWKSNKRDGIVGESETENSGWGIRYRIIRAHERHERNLALERR